MVPLEDGLPVELEDGRAEWDCQDGPFCGEAVVLQAALPVGAGAAQGSGLLVAITRVQSQR